MVAAAAYTPCVFDDLMKLSSGRQSRLLYWCVCEYVPIMKFFLLRLSIFSGLSLFGSFRCSGILYLPTARWNFLIKLQHVTLEYQKTITISSTIKLYSLRIFNVIKSMK